MILIKRTAQKGTLISGDTHINLGIVILEGWHASGDGGGGGSGGDDGGAGGGGGGGGVATNCICGSYTAHEEDQ